MRKAPRSNRTFGEVATPGPQRMSPNVTTTHRIMVTAAVSQRTALGALYDALGGSDWTHSDNWLTDASAERTVRTLTAGSGPAR